jgi:hypothetical protein
MQRDLVSLVVGCVHGTVIVRVNAPAWREPRNHHGAKTLALNLTHQPEDDGAHRWQLCHCRVVHALKLTKPLLDAVRAWEP